jgi:hypothetical protein
VHDGPRLCVPEHTGVIALPYTMKTAALWRCWGHYGVGVLPTVGVDNEANLAWLEEALLYAFAHSRPHLWAYLEAVMDDVLFEMELEARS